MVEFEDPVTDVTYDPLGDPTGTLMKAVTVVGGIAMTIVLFSLANSSVVPVIQNAVNEATGGFVDAGEDGIGIPTE